MNLAYFIDTCFIPTISALAITTPNANDWYYNVDANKNNLKTPFDAIRYQLGKNLFHIDIEIDDKNWFINQIYPNDLIVNPNDNYNIGEIKAGNTITFMPGFATKGAITTIINPLQN